MKKEINISGNNHQGTFEFAQSDPIDTNTDTDTEKMTWHPPKLRMLQISQETNTPCPSGGCFT